MTAPMTLREYFAASGSNYTKEDAEVIGPHIETLAEEGDASERRLVDVAQSSNSPLHRFFDWNDESAADRFRLHQAGTMLRSIRVKFIENDRPRTAPAYRIARTQPKSVFTRGHNVLHGQSAAAVTKAKDAFDGLTAWRARYAPFVAIWQDFAQAFRGVANQIGEAEDLVNTIALDDRTDEALTELQVCLSAVTAWRSRYADIGHQWTSLAEQATFIQAAIDESLRVFTDVQKAAERPCLRCGKAFQSSGPENRLCERCGTK